MFKSARNMQREKTVAKTTLLLFFFFRFLNVVCVEYIPAVYLSFRVRRMPNTLKVSLHTGFNHTEADGSDASNQKRRLNSHTFTHSIYTAHAHTHNRFVLSSCSFAFAGIDC